jgi:spoIIIJ-associated protein
MKKEFFAPTVEEALSKASKSLGIPEEELVFQALEQGFGEALQPSMVAIIVDEPEREQPVDPGPTEEEKNARAAGESTWATYLVKGILERMNIDAKTSSYERGEHVIVSVELDSSELDLRRGESREFRGAVQHIVNRSISRSGEDGRRFIVDIGGTLEQRREKIGALADEISEKLSNLKKSLHIHLMDSQDRRLLHMSLVESNGLSTQGRGEKLFRVLSLEPKK